MVLCDVSAMYVFQLMADKEMCHLGKESMQLYVWGGYCGFFNAFLSILQRTCGEQLSLLGETRRSL